MRTKIERERYLAAADNFSLLGAKEERFLFCLSVLRLVSFIGGFILTWYGFTINFVTGILLFLATAILFFRLLKLYSVHTDKKEFLSNLSLINRNEADALSGNFSAFDGGGSYTDTLHDFSNDVDLFGNFSLFQYLNRTVTVYGRDILAGWLADPYPLSDELLSRQEVIRELAGKEKWRHDFMATGMKKPLDKSHITGLLGWLAEPPSYQKIIR